MEGAGIHPWTGPLGDALDALVEDFNLHNEWGITVVPQPHSGLDELGRAMDHALQSGAPPDLLAANLHQALAWDLQRPFLNLRPFVDDPNWGLPPEQQADFYPAFWQQDVAGGQRLGVPLMRSGLQSLQAAIQE